MTEKKFEKGILYHLSIIDFKNDAQQPRKTLDTAALDELTASIKEHGILEPVLFKEGDQGYVTVVAGERRIEAAKKAGLLTIPALYVDGNAAEIALVENIQRQELNAIEEAKAYFKEQSAATHLPFIFLSAGVSASLFQETLVVAKEAGSTFNGVLCGRATWKDAVAVFASQGEEAAKTWLADQGRKNMEDLNAVLASTASPWTDKVQIQ